MKKIFFLSVIYILCNVGSCAQNCLSGNYYSESGIILKLEEDRFKLVMPNNAVNGWYSEIMAEGVIDKVSPSILELNTDKNTILKAICNIVVDQQMDSIHRDSIKVRFLIPYKKGKFNVSIFTDKFKTFNLDYSYDNNEMNIPNNTKTISFYISPKHIKAHTSEGLFYGIVGFDSMVEYQIKNQVNIIEIKIPDLDRSFFEKYYVRGEYARIVGNSIFWKGVEYKKESK